MDTADGVLLSRSLIGWLPLYPFHTIAKSNMAIFWCWYCVFLRRARRLPPSRLIPQSLHHTLLRALPLMQAILFYFILKFSYTFPDHSCIFSFEPTQPLSYLTLFKNHLALFYMPL